jgi:Domain of unknown function (DUF4149)
MARASLWLAALWWGSLTTVGFGVVPLLFVHLPTPAIAGGMAARLFSAQTWVSGICGLLLLMLMARLDRSVTAVYSARDEKVNAAVASVPYTKSATTFTICGILLAFLAEFAVAPRIVARENLKLWHAVGSAMYLLQWVCAGVALWKLTASRQV